MESTELIKRTTITELCVAYRQAVDQARQAFALLEAAQERLVVFYGDAPETKHYCRFDMFGLIGEQRLGGKDIEKLIDGIRRDCWRVLVDRIDIRKVMSLNRQEQLDAQLEGKTTRYGEPVDPLPEIEEANVWSMLERTADSIPQMVRELIKEVYDYLAPSERTQLVTNQKNRWGLTQKVILSWVVERWGGRNQHGGIYHVNYDRQCKLRALDNVMHVLDGKGTVKTTQGPLVDAIEAAPDGTGQTEYFEFKAFHNRNLHLKLKRLDLVNEFNRVAGGGKLPGER